MFAGRQGAARELICGLCVAGIMAVTIFASLEPAAGQGVKPQVEPKQYKAAPARSENDPATGDRDAGPAIQPAARGAGFAAPAAADESAAADNTTVAMLARQIEPVLRNANEQGVKGLIGELDDDQFSVREAASEQLGTMGRWAEPRLRTALRKAESEEARARLRRLIRAAESPTAASDGPRRLVRAVWALEQIGTAEAKALVRSIEQSPVNPLWRRFRAGEHVVEAGFLPDKVEYVWGEPMFYFTFVVKNVGTAPLQFTEGGDYRGGRSEGHQVTAVDAQGRAVPVPEMPRMGGRMGVQTLAPGGVYLKMLPVSRRFSFSGPGEYTVTGRRTLQLGGLDGKSTGQALPIATSFRLTIHPYSEARMREVVENLAAQIRAAGDLTPAPFEYTEPTSMSEANRLHLAMSALAGIKGPAVERHFVAIAKDAPPRVRAAALRRLGGFPSGEALAALLEGLRDGDGAIRAAAAAGLGAAKSDAAVDALLAALPKQDSPVAAAILRAMGETRSPRVFQVLVRSLSDKDAQRRGGAVAGLVAFGGPEAVKALRACVSHDDMDFRELVVRTLAESLNQPIDAKWLVPVIRSRRNAGSLGDAPRLLRLYTGDQAAPTLLSCLDFENPAVRSYYNWSIITSQLACHRGLVIPWNADLNRDGTPEEIQQNRRTLKIIKSWIDQYSKSDWREPLEPWRRGREAEEETWGQPVDGISIRARLNRHYWPEGMPQVVRIDARSDAGKGSIRFANKPDPFEVEVNGHWYQHDPKAKMVVLGEWGGYYGNRYHDIQLNDRWLRKADSQPLELEPGKYSLRVRLSTAAKDQQTGLATSRPVYFQVIAID